MSEKKMLSPEEFAEKKGFDNEEKREYFKERISLEWKKSIGGGEESVELPSDLSDEDIKEAEIAAKEYVWYSRGINLPQPEKDSEVSPLNRLRMG